MSFEGAEPLVEVWRGDFLESVHAGHAVVCDMSGGIVASFGNPDLVVLPRSSAKMLQALPLVTSGAADAAGLTPEHLALSCASHQGADIHTARVERWLADQGFSEKNLLCGPQIPSDQDAAHGLVRANQAPHQCHNNCSGKHAGFLTLAQHLGADLGYTDADNPVQKAVRTAFEEVTGETSPGFAVDGCSAPNFASTLHGLARAMAWYAGAAQRTDRASTAAVRLYQAMVTHPDLVAGEGRACTILMRAMQGRAAIKTGAEGVFVAILPERGLGIALKITDGTTRASECAITALLSAAGVIDRADPAAVMWADAPILNRAGLVTGRIAPVRALRDVAL